MSERCARCSARIPAGARCCPACLVDREIPPMVIDGKIEIGEELGRGGMGIVMRARHIGLARDVAVKFLAPEVSELPGFAARFAREAQALARLSHPGIVAVHDFGSHDGQSYIVMELAPGAPLSRLVPMDAANAIAIASRVADALAHAHAAGVIHRDVKPDNILVDDRGGVKVTDFGVARIAAPERSGAATQPTLAMGTPLYMAPEALRAAPPDPRMDVFSLGAVLHEMLTGVPPGAEIGPLPAGLDAVVRRALDPDPARRQRDMAELGRELSAPRAATALEAAAGTWTKPCALVLTVATSLTLFAILRSVTPRVMDRADVAPLTFVALEPLPDGRVVSWARFELAPTLAALAAWAVALGALAMARARWPRGRATSAPGPGREAGWVLVMGVLAIVVWGIRKALEASGQPWAGVYVPVLGGVIETTAVFVTWLAILEGAERGHRTHRDPRLLLGILLYFIPPTTELWRYVSAWKP
ncbi:MAG: serine/threonine-protein kinase [Acidobacteriota bacterium]